ncbi:MAG TPA: hypothetical protein VFL41_10430 [Gaiellaceae bacterium]|nr:hypothetical protein [Gaiellaceae bacterium]
MSGRRIAWEGAGQVVVADLDSGRRVAVAKGAGNSPVAMALSGSTVLWFDITGGNVREDTLVTASPGRRRKILANWYEDTEASAPVGPLFGGVTGKGRTLAFALYRLSPPGGNPAACYERPCPRRVSGGGTFTVTPGSLALHRVLPPAQAVAATDHALAAAVLRKGAVYTGKAQLVVKDLSNGTRRAIGAPASILAVGLDRNRVAALIGSEHGYASLLRVWNVATGRLVRSFHVEEVRPVLVLAGSHAVLTYGGSFFTLNIRTGHRRLFTPEYVHYGPWVTGGRLLWVETRDEGTPTGRSLIRSAPLPGPTG